MIYVSNGNEVEPLTQISGFEMNQEVKGSHMITFNSYPSEKNPAYRILLEEAIVTIGDNDYRIKQMKETRNGKSIVAINTFFDLVDKRQNEIYGGTRTFSEFINFIYKDTGWRTIIQDVDGSQFVPNFGENNVIALTDAICQVYQCEYKILPNNQVLFAKQIGRDVDAQYRYGHNVKALSKHVDTTKLKTYIEGFGAVDEENGGQLWVSYTSPYADRYGKREADPVYDDRFTQVDSFLEYVKNQIVDYPEVTFELDSIELLDMELGERVWLIYEPLDMEFQTRILSQTKQFVNGNLQTVKVVLGNTVPKSITDILISQKVEFDENKDVTRSKFEQTNDRITMEVEKVGKEIARIEIKADNIELSVNNRITKEMAEINIRADGIDLRVDKAEESIAEVNIKADEINTSVNNRITQEVSTINQRADQIELTVSSQGQSIVNLTEENRQQGVHLYQLDGAVTDANTRITQNANQISLKLDATDMNGERIANEINLGTGGVMIKGQNINLVGAVNVLSDITGNLGTITTGYIDIDQDAKVGNNIYLGQRFGGATKSIIFNGSNRINAIGSGLEMNAQQIKLSSADVQIGESSYARTGFNGTVDFSYAQVIGVAEANSNGIGISTDGSNLYVQVNGSTVGRIKFD